MRRIVTALLLFLLLAACADKAAELYETARLEELQNNPEHAVKLYREVVGKYPDSAQAKEAAKRLAELEKKKEVSR